MRRTNTPHSSLLTPHSSLLAPNWREELSSSIHGRPAPRVHPEPDSLHLFL